MCARLVPRTARLEDGTRHQHAAELAALERVAEGVVVDVGLVLGGRRAMERDVEIRWLQRALRVLLRLAVAACHNNCHRKHGHQHHDARDGASHEDE